MIIMNIVLFVRINNCLLYIVYSCHEHIVFFFLANTRRFCKITIFFFNAASKTRTHENDCICRIVETNGKKNYFFFLFVHLIIHWLACRIEKSTTTKKKPMQIIYRDFGTFSSPIHLRTYSLVMSSGSSDSNSCYSSKSGTTNKTDNHSETIEQPSPPAWHADYSR